MAGRSCGCSHRRSRRSWPRPWTWTRPTSGYKPVTRTSSFAAPSVTVVLTAIALTGRSVPNEDRGTAGSSMIRALTRWHRLSASIPASRIFIVITTTITTATTAHHRHCIDFQDYSIDHFPPGTRDRYFLDLESNTASLSITIEERAILNVPMTSQMTRNEQSPLF